MIALKYFFAIVLFALSGAMIGSPLVLVIVGTIPVVVFILFVVGAVGVWYVGHKLFDSAERDSLSR